ncbi:MULTISPECIES: RtcB family protein [Kosmotoga]|uniref:3'-phosphate/5'-hydroxy nucleic acid ligase n=1 Tax=Kosmotoga olearia (strain ATCC BAA-1733 / DSM 21960 / TBF 19.5.1) TaxID=521045 RepID=C5CHJ6_KOSOT|nr:MULTISPECIES: RtcB family protein [Kosmotoga]ACR79751.1 protein of unknown function UPF0027 [Kosmotoga olearia TBF 19.5.1]OAA21687.1 hypothetical protein DU53_05640 [Kosmotoga sp. DU53]
MNFYSPKLKAKFWIPVKEIEEEAMQQIRNLSEIPDVFRWIAVMPDVHPGYGMPIGCVVALKENVIPYAVGMDIGCGVVTVKTDLTADMVMKYRQQILKLFLEKIPVGFKWRKKALASDFWKREPAGPITERERKNAEKQLGTLGGGNHFIEIQKDELGNIYLTVHSGSRNLGKQVASYYDKIAREYCKKRGIKPPPGLAWLPRNSKSGRQYLAEMEFCMAFASENRRLLVASALEVMRYFFPEMKELERIETVHNYASLERHYGEKVLVHRKGAVLAKGKVIIPGSMGSPTYIAKGLCNPESFCSCSHGAGRVLGRHEAKRKLNFAEVKKDLDERNVVLMTPDKGAVIEEARVAYKDIDKVMDYQKDLVERLVKLTPLAVIKG